MAADRPAIPAQLKRDLLVEAGHRCAIPTCRQPVSLELEHIEDWSRVKAHEFSNMIVLCANCHSRKTRGEIDRKSLLQYKANLSVLNSRYGDLERRVLEVFALEGVDKTIFLPDLMRILLWYLLRDGLLVEMPYAGGQIVISGMRQMVPYGLSERGKEFVKRWLTARSIDDVASAAPTSSEAEPAVSA